MIVSHRHKFIYLRTEKTGSTALEEALLSILGPEDMVSSHGGGRSGLARLLPKGSLQRLAPRAFGLHRHAHARDVRAVLGPQVFDSYLKIAVERNVWDRQVSLYNHRKSRRGTDRRSFARDMANPLWRRLHHTRLRNWDVYAIGDSVVADDVILYENLTTGIARLSAQLRLDTPLQLARRNDGHRTDAAHYSVFYTDPVRDLVGRMYRREVERFGFTFDDRRPGSSSSNPGGAADAQPDRHQKQGTP